MLRNGSVQETTVTKGVKCASCMWTWPDLYSAPASITGSENHRFQGVASSPPLVHAWGHDGQITIMFSGREEAHSLRMCPMNSPSQWSEISPEAKVKGALNVSVMI